jgi:adenylate cyclase
LDAVKVKGKNIPVKIYELCITNQSELNKQYEKALDLYFKNQFKKAEQEFKKAIKISPSDLSSKTFIERCKQYQSNPPKPNWDGSFEMKTK